MPYDGPLPETAPLPAPSLPKNFSCVRECPPNRFLPRNGKVPSGQPILLLTHRRSGLSESRPQRAPSTAPQKKKRAGNLPTLSFLFSSFERLPGGLCLFFPLRSLSAGFLLSPLEPPQVDCAISTSTTFSRLSSIVKTIYVFPPRL